MDKKTSASMFKQRQIRLGFFIYIGWTITSNVYMHEDWNRKKKTQLVQWRPYVEVRKNSQKFQLQGRHTLHMF